MHVAMATLYTHAQEHTHKHPHTHKEAKPMLIFTHGDVGQLVCGAVRVDAVQLRPVAVHPTEDQRRADVALIP